MALGRRADEHIIAAATGASLTGHSGTTSVALPAGQKLAVTLGHASGITNAGMSIEKLLGAKQILDQNEVVENAQRFIAVRAQQITDLLLTTEVTSRDYNNVQALVRGDVDSFIGFTFKRLELLAHVASTDITTCFAWSEKGILLATGCDIKSRITEESTKNYATQVWSKMYRGATRMEEKQVVEIPCDESPA